ncbi:restriction endonuclease S subunit [Nostoc sp. PCC 7524]|uniref:restriction endonuclease subunit S n=1 Tax=Nostoc sp. (strain ATCC 29411 / PCC 7524) TaxID=28072 RepID=UPI00029F0828|nr:restriction endonuclease subunit S [Nostoc sp. PCC 7524]AFY49596.1 restriction endonuclease S subunit [Nostoc sp. PCC 7524]
MTALENIVNFSSGGTPSRENFNYWNGDIPWISASSMYCDLLVDSDQKITVQGLNNGSRLAKKGSILILVRGSILYNRIPMGIAGRDLSFNQDVKALKVLTNDKIEFLFFWLKSQENLLKSMVTGTGIGAGKLDLFQLQSLTTYRPTLAEQEKIASFLGAVDTRLNQLRRKRELLQTYKCGVMQKIFAQKIRFKDAIGSPFPDWEERKLGDFIIEHQERVNANTHVPIYSSSREGLKPQKEYFSDRELKNEGEYGVVPKNFFVYRHMSDDITFKFNINDTGEDIAVSKEYPVFTTKNS